MFWREIVFARVRWLLAPATGLCLLVLFLSGLALAEAGPATTPLPGELVINEFLSDPAAVSDTAGEWVELHNSGAGLLDLQGCVLHATGTNTHTVADTLTVPAGGFLVLGKSIDQEVNGGAPVDYAYGSSFGLGNTADEIILDCSGQEIDRVEYDETAGWPAAGAGYAVGYAGSGDNNDGGNWCLQESSYGAGDRGTPGAANDPCQAPNYPLPGELIISEFLADPAAVSDTVGEWVEVMNISGNDRDLNGCVLHASGTNTHTIGLPVPVSGGSLVVLGRSADPDANGGVVVDYAYGSSFTLASTADQIILDCGGQEVDRVEYDAGAGWPAVTAGSALGYGGSGDNNDGGNWCLQVSSFGAGDRGTPGMANDACEAPDYPAPGQVVITEFMADPAAVGDSLGEWFELWNASDEAVHLAGCVIRDDGSNSHAVASLDITPGTYAVLARNGDPAENGGVTADYVYPGTWSLSSEDEIVLVCGGQEVDRVAYGSGVEGWPPVPAGASLGWSGEGGNDNGVNWCDQVSIYGAGDRGTPGTANDPCHLQCDVNGDLLVSVADVQSVAGVFAADPAPPTYDLDPNGVIDVLDVIVAVQCWLMAGVD